jgi:pimeloyl-[acyl-carrier protein] methyl ester esterase
MALYHQTTGQGPNIVLLHGWGVHSGIWQFIVANLTKDFAVTLVDLPGFGRSDVIPDYSMAEIVKQLHLVTPPEAIWIGWSLGGLIATRFALTYPLQVKKLICVASSPRFLEEKHWPGMSYLVLKKFNEQLQVDYKGTLTRFLLLQFYGTTVDKALIHWLKQHIFLYGEPAITTLNGGLAIL